MNKVAHILSILDKILPPDEEANELNCAPSWLSKPDGSRGIIDIWYPGVPLAVTVEKLGWFGRKRRKREYEFIATRLWEDWQCPHLVIDARAKINEQIIVEHLRRICKIYPDKRVEGLRFYAYRNGT